MSITDSLDGTAHARGVSAGDLAESGRSRGHRHDLLTGSERTTDRIFHRLLREAQDGGLDRSVLSASWQRILRVKERLQAAVRSGGECRNGRRGLRVADQIDVRGVREAEVDRFSEVAEVPDEAERVDIRRPVHERVARAPDHARLVDPDIRIEQWLETPIAELVNYRPS